MHARPGFSPPSFRARIMLQKALCFSAFGKPAPAQQDMEWSSGTACCGFVPGAAGAYASRAGLIGDLTRDMLVLFHEYYLAGQGYFAFKAATRPCALTKPKASCSWTDSKDSNVHYSSNGQSWNHSPPLENSGFA